MKVQTQYTCTQAVWLQGLCVLFKELTLHEERWDMEHTEVG
jgi:hypothetical protein